MSNPNPAGSVSLAELVALNDEMAALVRSGTSLEQGLVDLGAELPGQLGNLATRLGQRLQSGESLAGILADDPHFPAVWRAMVVAGIRSGRLAVVLESLASTGRRIAEMRRAIGAALIYPLIVILLAYVVFVFLVTYLAPILVDSFRNLTTTSDPLVTSLAWLGEHVTWWVFWPPAILLAVLVMEWFQSRRGYTSSAGPISRFIASCWPAVRRSRRDARLATFVEILSLLIRERTPLAEAVMLAANASGDEPLRVSASALAERLGGGQSLSANDVRSLAIPPLLGFMLTTGAPRAELADALAATAARYRERSSQAAMQTAMILPILLTTFLGGVVTLALGLTTIWPIWRLVLQLGSTT